MSVVKIALAASVLATLAGTAGAAPARLSDADYVSASRCLGLMESKPLATPEATAMKTVVDTQGVSRDALARDAADTARSDAEELANHANAGVKLRLTAERDGSCQAWLPATDTSAISSSSHSD